MTSSYNHKEDNMSSINQPNKAQLALFRDYVEYIMRFKEMSPLLHDKEDAGVYKFLCQSGLLKTHKKCGEYWTEITKQGQSLARAMGYKLDLLNIPLPNTSINITN